MVACIERSSRFRVLLFCGGDGVFNEFIREGAALACGLVRSAAPLCLLGVSCDWLIRADSRLPRSGWLGLVPQCFADTKQLNVMQSKVSHDAAISADGHAACLSPSMPSEWSVPLGSVANGTDFGTSRKVLYGMLGGGIVSSFRGDSKEFQLRSL